MAERAGQTILIVEDDGLFRRSLATFVSALGYGTVICASAEEALRRDDLEEVNLCIVDYQLPGLSGVDFLEGLRTRGLRVPVLLMSGYLNDAIRSEAVREGALEVLHKPMDMALLVQRLARALASPATA
jgi:two-component system response regulator FixJ